MLCSPCTKSSSGRTRSRQLGVVRSSRREEAAPLSRTDPGRKKKGSCFRPRMDYHIALYRVPNVRDSSRVGNSIPPVHIVLVSERVSSRKIGSSVRSATSGSSQRDVVVTNRQ